MGFSREDLASYEKQPVVVIADPVTGKMPAAAAAPTPAPEEAPVVDSSSAIAPDPADPVDASSDAPADSSPAAEASDSDPTRPAEAGKGRTIPMDRFEAVNDEKNALKAYGKLKDEESQQLRAEIARLQGKSPTSAVEQPAAAAPAPAADDPMPTLASVNYDETAFQKKMTDWVRREASRTTKAELASERQKDDAAKIRSDYTAREASFAEKNPDFNTVVNNPNLPKLEPKTARAIVTSEDGPAIIYHLGKNPDEAVRLSRLTADMQLMRLGEIRTKIAAAAAAQPAQAALGSKTAAPAQKTAQRSVTQAPPPPTPTPAGASNGSKSVSEMGMEEFVAHERGKKIKEREDRRKARGLRA